jgi:hypothetical protein
MLAAITGVGLLGMAALDGSAADNTPAPKKKNFFPQQRKQQTPQNVAPPAPKSALLKEEDWQKASQKPVASVELDQLVARELQAEKVQPAALTTDEQFIRRVTLDLTGELPAPADVTEFAADKDPLKRARLIDKLLGTEEYAKHWAHYWHEVVTSHITANPQSRLIERHFEHWLTEQFKQNQSWAAMAKAMIAAEGEVRSDDVTKNGNAFFLLSHRGTDAANEQAAEVSRVFMGVQIQCAQCHDHPSDQWKRVQFHQLAAYFAKFQTAPIRNPGTGQPLQGFRFGPVRPGAEHQMPSKEDPKKMITTYPVFLNGKAIPPYSNDLERRRALADAVTDKSNFWFAGAYVNRIWGELMGQSFYQPVDDVGPQKEAVFASVLTRLAGSFRGTDYDMKVLFRAIMNSDTYQRQIRLGESSDQHLHFAAAYPTRLHADALWASLTTVLGSMGGPINFPGRGPMGGPFGNRLGFEGQFKDEFAFDPSLKASDIEGSISQALMMMNNPVINQRIRATGTNVLARILSSYPQDDDALRMVYLKTLARKPTDKEQAKCREYLAKVNSRSEAFEDILWALLNSTEFQTKR